MRRACNPLYRARKDICNANRFVCLHWDRTYSPYSISFCSFLPSFSPPRLLLFQDVVEKVEDGIVFSMSLKPPPSSSPGHGQDGPSTDSPVRVRVVKAGTVERLTEHLAPYRTEVDVSYRTCFLATYRTFTTPSRILALLSER